jgi:hypothetical protein
MQNVHGCQETTEPGKLENETQKDDSHLQRVTIPEAAYIQLRRRPHENEHDNARNM